MSQYKVSVLLMGVLLALSFTACTDDEIVVCPDDPHAAPAGTMANIWPHEDGIAWVYDLAYQEHIMPPPSEGKGHFSKTTELPTMADLHAQLQNPLPGTPDFSTTGIYRFAFDGEVTTDSGVTAQNVTETLFFEPEAGKGDGHSNNLATPDRLLRLIAQTRPDLRAEIVPLLDPQAKDMDRTGAPFFIGGYAFSGEDDGYFSYGDLDANHSWVYLDSSLETGTEFSLQLVPVIADDIWLYGRIWSQGDLEVGGMLFENVVECMYLVDMGIQEATDEDGNIIATFRSYMYGSTHFAPGVGPIRGIERRFLAPDHILYGEDDFLNVEYQLEFIGSTQTN